MKRLFAYLALVVCAGCEVDLNRMLDQHKYEAYEASPYFANGQAMRTPPQGTLPYARELPPAIVTSGMEGQKYTQDVPLVVDELMLERGEDRFQIFCRTCHGSLGDGNSEVAKTMRLRKPPSLHEPRIRAYPAGRLYRVIAHGYGLMPAYAAQLGLEDRWAVVAFVQALQLSQGVPLAALPAYLHEEAEPWLK